MAPGPPLNPPPGGPRGSECTLSYLPAHCLVAAPLNTRGETLWELERCHPMTCPLQGLEVLFTHLSVTTRDLNGDGASWAPRDTGLCT